MKKITCYGLWLLCVLCARQSRTESYFHVQIVRPNPANSGQDFVCVSPYTVPECASELAILQTVLRRYHSEQLGNWTWVLIRSADWKQILTRLHLDPSSPAFTHLGMRQTFIEEALLVPKPNRQDELFKKWHIPLDRFLDFAISHELGHAFCQESDEIKAERIGQRLRKGKAIACDR